MNKSFIVHKATGASPYWQILIIEEVIQQWLCWVTEIHDFNSPALEEAKCCCRERGHRMNSPKASLLKEDWANLSAMWERTIFGPSRREELCFGGFSAYAWSGQREMSYELVPLPQLTKASATKAEEQQDEGHYCESHSLVKGVLKPVFMRRNTNSLTTISVLVQLFCLDILKPKEDPNLIYHVSVSRPPPFYVFIELSRSMYDSFQSKNRNLKHSKYPAKPKS